MADDSKIAFITCTNNEEWYDECLLYLKSLEIPEHMTAEFLPIRGAASMAAGYNQGMKATDAKYKVYLHQDVLLVKKDFVRKVLDIFKEPSIGAIGMIGCRSLPATGVWWDGMRRYGRVLHACEPESIVDGLHRVVPEAGAASLNICDYVYCAIRDRIRSAGGLEPDAMTIRGFIDALRAEPLLGLRWGLLDNVASKPQDAYTRLQLTELIESMVPQDGRI